jgi:hypothetical protein
MAYADLKRWAMEWLPRPDLPRAARPEEGEIEVLQQLLTMATDGTLDYLAICACGEWFVRRRFDQQYCKPECRTHSPQFKTHRRRYMKDYYNKHFKKSRRARKRG